MGAGDSYAVALAGFYASRGRCLALDPYSLASVPEIAKGLEVYFISISGRTSSNLAAARRVKGIAKRTTALTVVEDSDLAKLTDRMVRLPMSYVPRTPGLLSFSLSLLAVLKMVGAGERCDFSRSFGEARKERGRLLSSEGTTYFLGNFLAYPVALYAAAKDYELLGNRAHAELLEEFSHLELFSLGKKDAVNAFSCFDPSGAAVKLTKTLKNAGYDAYAVPSRGGSEMERLFHSVFAAQLSVLDRAVRTGLGRPTFLSAGSRLRTSDLMIY